jgi:thiol-disulfide isomerase/thioredoxin
MDASRRCLALFAVASAWLVLAGFAHAQERSEPRALWDAIVQAYKTLPAYADHGALGTSYRLNGHEESREQPLALAFVRPNKLALDAEIVRVVSDGKTLKTLIVPSKRWIEEPAPPAIKLGMLENHPVGASLFGNPSLTPAALLLNLLVGDDPTQWFLGPDAKLQLDPDRRIEGKTLRVLRVDQPPAPSLLLWVDPETKLLAGIEQVVGPADLTAKAPPGTSLTDLHVVWRSGLITTEPPKDEVFTLQPPPGFVKVASIKARFEAAKQGRAPEPAGRDSALVGKPAPDFKLTALAGAGKTKIVTKADLAGKVIVIDFWATWCGPCLRELPEIQKLVDQLAESKKNVVVIALSQDRQPADRTDLRKLIETTLDENGLKLAEGPVSLVALDPEAQVGDAFEVQAYPTVVLIDAQGIVQAVHLGFAPNVGEVLAEELETLLSGKSLAGEKP